MSCPALGQRTRSAQPARRRCQASLARAEATPGPAPPRRTRKPSDQPAAQGGPRTCRRRSRSSSSESKRRSSRAAAAARSSSSAASRARRASAAPHSGHWYNHQGFTRVNLNHKSNQLLAAYACELPCIGSCGTIWAHMRERTCMRACRILAQRSALA